VNLYVNGTLLYGNNMTARFYSYSGAYQAETTVWNGTTPAYVFISQNVSHPLGLPVEIAVLVLTNEAGDMVSILTDFIMCRCHLMERLAKLDESWLYTSPSKRPEIFFEIVNIDKQWPYAPT